MEKIEATLVQAYNYARAFIVSSIKHAEFRAKELERMLERFSGRQTRVAIATILAKTEYWIDYSDQELAWIIETGEGVGIVRWHLKNRRDAKVKEFALRLIQEIKRKLEEIRQKCAICLAGIIFEIERDAVVLIKNSKLFEEEEERRQLLEEMDRFINQIEEEVQKRVKRKLKKFSEVEEGEVIEI